MNDLLTQLLQKLDEPQARFSLLDSYYAGESPLAYLAPAALEALGNRLRKVSINIPRLLVDSVAERLRVTGFSGADVWPDWLACDLDQTSRIAHKEALVLGSAWAIVLEAGPDGRPSVSIESSHQMAAITDPSTPDLVRGEALGRRPPNPCRRVRPGGDRPLSGRAHRGDHGRVPRRRDDPQSAECCSGGAVLEQLFVLQFEVLAR